MRGRLSWRLLSFSRHLQIRRVAAVASFLVVFCRFSYSTALSGVADAASMPWAYFYGMLTSDALTRRPMPGDFPCDRQASLHSPFY